ncbi:MULTISPECIES: TonB-dependent receptor domain-containing protein [unclassified Cellvibrio]|uniref:TonB-dependent receptor domain-containing protein n=1 Tax=unclassified Cellvibrio TaxID=2624793 RepID=UPI001247B2CC|nr:MULTISPECIES: TonB-dependent receptor [unclassified Cellvibrio]QEY14900.1 TonB-dependent receptor [Cellvibrio sp. KY-GH-1]UUA73823.1 TonB-dependent receptor [Cellvibrio sp. QJXJ]
MSNITHRLRITALSAAICAVNSGVVYAQQEAVSAQQDQDVEEVVVTGIRGSIKRSVDDKREARKIVDTINAEDIGKSTDQNIAEALNRVSGVSMNTSDGEGKTVSIRGANADQTVVTMNGTALGSTGFSQGVDLSSYSADILSKIEVIKTPSADDEEGSLGGLVNLTTRKPLDIKEDVRTVSLQGRMDDQSEEFDHKFVGTFSQKFADDSIGVLVTVNDEENKLRRDQYHAQDYSTFGSNAYTDGRTGQAYANSTAMAIDAASAAAAGRAPTFAGAQAVDPYANPLFWTHGGAEHNRSIVQGLAPNQMGYQLFENDYKRQGVDLSLQWQASDTTDLTFSANYSQADVSNRMDGVFVNTSRMSNFIDGASQQGLGLGSEFWGRTSFYDNNPVEYGGTEGGAPTDNDQMQWTDPQQQWHVLDPKTRTWTTLLNRESIGSIEASVNNYETENSLYALELNHDFSDRFRMVAGASVNESIQTPKNNVYLTANTSRVVGPWNLHHVPANLLNPAGYDCSSGNCRLNGGYTAPASLGNNVDLDPSLNDLWDNIGTSGFDPDVLENHTLSYIQATITEVSDKQETAFVDFDFDLDSYGITTVEFGAKVTHREKFVNNQSGTPRPSDERVQSISPFTGETLSIDASNINLIQVTNFADGKVDANGFLSGLGYAKDNITDGWLRFDPIAAINAVSQGERAFTLDNTQTRGAEFDNVSAYIKANFEFMDERIQGDVGFRHVRTEVETNGFAGTVFGTTSSNGGRVIDPIQLMRMREVGAGGVQCPSLAETPSPLDYGTNSIFWNPQNGSTDTTLGTNYSLTQFFERNRWARVDGTGFNTNGTPFDYSDDTPIAATNSGLCYDPILEPGVIPSSFFERNLVRYADISTDLTYPFDANGVRQLTESGNIVSNDRSRNSVAAIDNHTYDIILPSLNVSFAAREDLITRFAASKTMARPPIDDLRAGARTNEGDIFGSGIALRPSSTVQLFTAKIDPLESTNLDFSVEWYFNDSGMVSANIFTKDIKNMIEVKDYLSYIGDLRKTAANPDGTSYSNGVFSVDGQDIPLLLSAADVNTCMPRRLQGEAALSGTPELIYGNNPDYLCNQYTVTQNVNAAKASVEGIELNYVQNFDFLPGIWSGLGTSMNFTYQEGTFDKSREVIPGAPKESYNATVYWAQDGHQIRLAWSGASDVLEQTAFAGGSRWREGRQTLDLSSSYALTDSISLQFDVANLTNETVRTYFTSRTLVLPDANGNPITFNEGSAINGNAPTNRTLDEYTVGRTFRVGIRAEF